MSGGVFFAAYNVEGGVIDVVMEEGGPRQGLTVQEIEVGGHVELLGPGEMSVQAAAVFFAMPPGIEFVPGDRDEVLGAEESHGGGIAETVVEIGPEFIALVVC